MNRRIKTIIIFLSLTVKVECDIFDELLVSVKKLHDKMDKTNEKVEQLQNDLNILSIDCNEKLSTTSSSLKSLNKDILKIEEKMDRANEDNVQRFAKTVELHEANNKNVQNSKVSKFVSKVSV